MSARRQAPSRSASAGGAPAAEAPVAGAPAAAPPASPPAPDWNDLNPMAMWRDWLVRNEAQWSDAVATLMKDPRASGPLNRQVEEARHAQRLFAEMAQGTLAMANLPSRSDFEALDERLGRVEDAVAALGAELTRLREALVAAGHATAADARPPRTRKSAAPAPRKAAS